jgi:Holliday junction resolvase RusA-like endonuclease
MTQLHIRVYGRPAPQGSKTGAGREASPYLPAWRADVKRAALRAMIDSGRPPLPMFPAGIAVRLTRCVFLVPWPVLNVPDIDKLLRSTLDALGGSRAAGARVFADDSQVVRIDGLAKEFAPPETPPGALLTIEGDL